MLLLVLISSVKWLALVFVLLVVLLVIPTYHRSEISPLNRCINQLRQIDGTIESMAIQRQLPTNTSIAKPAIEAELGRPIPKCPENGKYSYGIVGQEPKCSIHSSFLRVAD